MRRIGWVAVAAVLAVLVALGAARGLTAQEVVVAGGFTTYDLSGTGDSWVASAKYLRQVHPHVRVEAGTAVFGYEGQAGPDYRYVLPEVGVVGEASVRGGGIYLAAGGGWAFEVAEDAGNDPTLFAAVGARLPVSDRATLRPEMRIRAVDPWTGTMADFTLGLGWRFGG